MLAATLSKYQGNEDGEDSDKVGDSEERTRARARARARADTKQKETRERAFAAQRACESSHNRIALRQKGGRE